MKNNKTNKVLKLRPNYKGYLKTNISINGKLKTVFVHRLVAETFLPSSYENLQVNHKDGNKLNNHVSNLEWITASENIKHAYRIGLNKGNGKKVYQKNTEGNIVNVYNSTREAARYLGNEKFSSRISMACNGKIEEYRGYKWSYD